MTLRDFFRRFLWHLFAATLLLFVVLLVGEYLAPGSVVPFVDLVDLGVVIVGCLVVVVVLYGGVLKKEEGLG